MNLETYSHVLLGLGFIAAVAVVIFVEALAEHLSQWVKVLVMNIRIKLVIRALM